MSYRREETITAGADWLTISLYGILVLLGWMNIFASIYDPETHKSIFDFSINSGKQILWIGTSIVLIVMVLVIDYRFYDSFAYILYGLVVLSLIAVLLFGKKVSGSQSWFEVAGVSLQPSEFAKLAVALALSKYMSAVNVRMDRIKHQLIAGCIILLPAGMILLQNDTGSFLVFSSFLLVFYREGMSPILLIVGIFCAVVLILTLIVPQLYLILAFAVIALVSVFVMRKKSLRNIGLVAGVFLFVAAYISSVDYFINHVLQPHQQTRIKVLIDPDMDPLGAGWQVTQAKIAIGSGGFLGKGYLEGTQTKFDFVPDQSTDNIFCTVGEEHGWLGSVILISLFIVLFLRLIFLAERQKTKFARVFGYCVVSVLFFHFMINIGMTIGLFPVIGIPLPFFSYGGSSLWSFTMMLFIFLNLDANKRLVL